MASQVRFLPFLCNLQLVMPNCWHGTRVKVVSIIIAYSYAAPYFPNLVGLCSSVVVRHSSITLFQLPPALYLIADSPWCHLPLIFFICSGWSGGQRGMREGEVGRLLSTFSDSQMPSAPLFSPPTKNFSGPAVWKMLIKDQSFKREND